MTYGTASAPYLATRCLIQIADDIQASNPHIAEIIRSDFYVDDLLSGADSIEEAAHIQEEVMHILQSYGFPLRKWASNENDVLDKLKSNETQAEFLTNPDAEVKTLGLKWNRETDCLGFKVKLKENPKFTKRAMLSEIASIFDPLGYAAPVIIVAKMLMQDIWKTGTDWDQAVPPEILAKYEKFRVELPKLEEIVIPRWTQATKAGQLELHAFSDASEKAYAAVVYIRVNTGEAIHSNIIASKTRVAPTKTITLPRLELMAAVLATQLVMHVKQALKRADMQIHCYSDSEITLAWIKAEPSRFKTFVANRIAEIQRHVAPQQWHYVNTKENPADLASRGIMPQELKEQNIWFHGPKWLLEEFTPPPVSTMETTEEMKKPKVLHVKSEDSFIDKISSYHRLISVTAFIIRCKRNFQLRKKGEPIITGIFSVQEREEAFQAICAMIQQQYF